MFGGYYRRIDQFVTKGHFTIISTHSEWQGDARMYRWNVNEIECKHGKRTWCSDEMLEKLKKIKLI
jgi:hypothetical protein